MLDQRMGSTKRAIASLVEIALFFILMLCLLCPQGLAQRAMRNRPNEMVFGGNLMFAPREVQVLIAEAKTNIEKEQWSEATLTLGILLGLEEARQDDLTGIDFFLFELDPSDTVKIPKRSVYQNVFELIESLPLEATKFIDLRYGVRASQLLEKAISDSDWAAITKVAGQFSFTTAGQDACIILGEHWLRNGDPRRASRFLSMAFRQKSAVTRLGAELGVLTAAAYQSAGMQADAKRCIESTQKQFSKVTMNWKGASLAWDSRSVSADILKGIGSGGGRPVDRIVKQPYYFGGNPSWNADTNAGVPLPILRWHMELHESKQHKENLARTLVEKLSDQKSTFIPSRYPISVGEWIITTTYDQRIIAIDAQTGRLGWECFFSGMPLGFSMERFPSRDSHSLNLAAPDYLTKRVWGETAVGMVSSDGQRIFGVSELPAIDIAESFAVGQNARVTKPQGFRNFNVMQCWSIREEGKLKWEVGGQKSLGEPKLAGTLFLGAPLPYDNELLVMGELNSDVYLIAIAPETGKLIWRQPMSTNMSSIALDQMRRSIGVVPSADGAIIVCPTFSGYLVAFDAVSHALLWSFKYRVKDTPGSSNQFALFGPGEPGEFAPLQGRSADVSVLIDDGVVLFAPSDGEGVYAISVDTGDVLWQTEPSLDEIGKQRKQPKLDQVRYVGGVWNGIVPIACQSSLLGMDLKTGLQKWPPISIPNNAQVVGRGVRKGGSYFLPTSGREILQIDLQKGTVVESVQVEQPLGNLVATGDRLISASPFQLDCYSVREAFQSALKEELQRNSISKSGLTRQAELALAKGDYDSALNYLEQAKKLGPKDAETLMLLNKVGIAALTHDFDKYVDRVRLAEDLAFDRERSPYLRMLIHGLEKQGRYQDAILKLFELSELRMAQRLDQLSGSDFVSQSQQLMVQEDRWISSQIRKCYEKLSPSQIKELGPTIDLRLVAISKLLANVGRLRLEHMEAIPATEPMRVASARKLVEQRDLLQAERLLLSDGLLDSADPKSEPALRRRALLAEIYTGKRRYELALGYLDGDETRLAAIRNSLKEFTASEVNVLPITKRGPKPLADWPKGPIQVTVRQVNDASLSGTNLEPITRCRWKTRIGQALDGWSVDCSKDTWMFSNAHDREEFRCYIPVGIQDKNSFPMVHSVDSIAFIELNRQILAINTLVTSNSNQDSLLWRESFDVDTPESELGRGKSGSLSNWGLPTARDAFRVISVSRSGIIVLNEDKVMCLDLTTGNKLWTSLGFKNCHFAAHNELLLVFQPKDQTIIQLDSRDGSRFKETKLQADDLRSVASLGKFFLMESISQDSKGLRLIDGINGHTVFNKKFSDDTCVALDRESGLIALQPTGDLAYWNILDEKEFEMQVEVEGFFKSISTQRFGDTILILPHAPSIIVDNIQVAPDNDPAFAPVAGRLIAISAKDGKSLWTQNNHVRRFYFPIVQDRNSPAAIFVRRLTLAKVTDPSGNAVSVDRLSVAIVDIRDGQVLFAQDDLPAIRSLGFTQQVESNQDLVSLNYLGTNVEMRWGIPNKIGEVDVTKPVYDFGDIDFKDFKRAIEIKLRQPQVKDPQSSIPIDKPSNK